MSSTIDQLVDRGVMLSGGTLGLLDELLGAGALSDQILDSISDVELSHGAASVARCSEELASFGSTPAFAHALAAAASPPEWVSELTSAVDIAHGLSSVAGYADELEWLVRTPAMAHALDLRQTANIWNISAIAPSALDLYDQSLNVLLDPWEELHLAATDRFALSGQCQSWIEEHRGVVAALESLSGAAATYDAFDPSTLGLLESVVGVRSIDVIDSLSRATSLRQRRGLYRELGFDPYIEDLPNRVIRSTFIQPQSAPTRFRNAAFLNELRRNSPLTKIHQRCYRLVGDLETFLRNHIHGEMGRKYGEEWVFQIPTSIRKRLLRGHEQKQGPSSRTVSGIVLLSYSDFNDLIEIIASDYDHRQYDLTALNVRLMEVKSIRNSTAHYRALLNADWVALEYAVIEIGKALGSADASPSQTVH